MKKKNKKTKAEKRMMKFRRSIILNVNGEELADNFSAIVGTIWQNIQDVDSSHSDDREMLQALINLCIEGWNCAVLCENLSETEECIVDDFSDDCDEPELEMMKVAARLKLHLCPDDRILIQEASGFFEDGEPAVSVSFDWDAAEQRAKIMADKIPSIDEILNHDAIQKAVAGVPPEKIKNAMEAEIRRQVEEYNNTPQDDLGGISPAEAYRRKH